MSLMMVVVANLLSDGKRVLELSLSEDLNRTMQYMSSRSNKI
jgi:hypothetical protein